MKTIEQLIKDCPWRWMPDQEEYVENGKFCCLGQFNTYQGYHVCNGPNCAPVYFAYWASEIKQTTDSGSDD